MKTYKDLIKYSKTLSRREVNWSDRVETLFDLVYGTLDTVETFPHLSEAVVVSDSLDLRAYYYSVYYFNDQPFVIYTMGGRSERDHENIYVLDKIVWKGAKQYVLSLIKEEEDCINELDLNSYILPEYGGEYPWEYLSEEHHPDFYLAKVGVLVNDVPIELTGYGYSEDMAKSDLQKSIDRWTDMDVEFGTPTVQKI
jgi:hypothetical protein